MTPKELLKLLYPADVDISTNKVTASPPTSERISQLSAVAQAYALLDMDLVADLVTETYERIPKPGQNDREFILGIIEDMIKNEQLAMEQQASRALVAKASKES